MVGTHEDYMKHREKRLAYGKIWYQKNKVKITAWKKKYREENKDKIKTYRRKKYLEETNHWHENSVGNASTKAETIVMNLLKKDGYNEIWKPTRNFYFDWLAKKNNKTYAIEVTTNMQKSLNNFHIKFLNFFNLSLIIFFVRPDLTKVYMIKSTDNSQKYFHYKQSSGICEAI